MSDFAAPVRHVAHRIVTWQRDQGRHHLPWQHTRDPYRIWLSEIMLQQTQVATVLGYYTRFLEQYPTIEALAAADLDDVMRLWAGLGYYARARNLHRCAQVVCESWDGRFPPTAAQIAELPGIGRSTAAAIAAFAYGERAPILDGNVKRTFARYFGVEGPVQTRAVETKLWAAAEAVLAADEQDIDMTAYTQGLMDLGAQVCRRNVPACEACPLRTDCYAYRHGLQATLPTPRPRKTLPERYCHMLILESDAHVLLERRPNSGIWGGLWGLPTTDEAPDVAPKELPSAALNVDLQPLTAFAHTFTHFRLHITPWFGRAETSAPMPAHAEQLWVHVTELASLGMPAPVRNVLDQLYPAEPALAIAVPADTD